MKKLLVILGFAGLAFAGYMSASKLVLGQCAFNETCPYFLGYPACYYGFIMYALITICAVLIAFEAASARKMLTAIIGVSAAGILFAGYFALEELPVFFQLGFRAYMLGLPTCALGLLFYIVIFCVALCCLLRERKNKS